MNKILFIISLLAFSSSFSQTLDSIQQLDEVVVSGTKYPMAKRYSGKIIATISHEELQQNPQKSVAQLLNEITGFELNGAHSVAGKNLGTYVEGGKAGQVLVIIDGIPVIDPSGIDMSYDLNMLSASQIESVEVMRGAAGTLYGSGAATAVINIKTLNFTAKKLNVEVGSTLRTQRSQDDSSFNGSQWSQNIALTGQSSDVSYLVSYSGNKAQGLSEAYSLNTDFKDNPFERQQVLGKFGFKLSNAITLQLTGNYTHAYHQFDQDAYTDSDVNTAVQEEFKLGLHSQWTHQGGNLQWNTEVKSGERDYRQFSTWTNTLDSYLYKTNSFQSDLFHLWKWTNKVDVLSGLNYQFHQTDNTTPYGDIDKKTGKFNSWDSYVQVNIKDFYGFNLALGSRSNIHNVYGTHTAFSINPSYVFDFKKDNSLKFLGSWSSAYLVPSIYQLYSNYGNEDLKPETTETLEFGMDFTSGKKFTFNALYFERKETNSIIFVTDSQTWVSNYQNDMESAIYVSGVETGMTYNPLSTLKLKVNYTYTEASKVRPYSIPKHKWNTTIRYELKPFKTQFNLGYQYVSDRLQMDFSSFPYLSKSLKNYHLWEIGVEQKFLKDKLSLHVAAENVFNADYVETIGYNTLGRNFSVSLNYKW